MDNATIGETILQYVVLHNFVVAMRVDTDVFVMGETEVHDGVEYTMDMRVAGNAMNHMIWLRVFYPLAFIDSIVSGLW